MTETASRSEVTDQTDQSTTDQAKEKMQQAAGQVQQKTLELKEEVKGQTGARFREEFATRSNEAGAQLGYTANAMRRSGDQLRNDGKELPAKIVTGVADRAERFGSYLSEVDADQILRDVENFARRQPVLFAAGGATLGFLAARFMKASSRHRYESGNGNGGYQPYAYQPGELGRQGSASEGSVYSATPQPTETDDPAISSTGSKRGGSSGNSGH